MSNIAVFISQESYLGEFSLFFFFFPITAGFLTQKESKATKRDEI